MCCDVRVGNCVKYLQKRDALKPHIVQLDECEAPGGGGRGSFCLASLPGAI